MNRLSGYVFDAYDDEGGQILRSVFENPHDLPDMVKTASRLTQDEIESLPDDQFALVMFEGTKKFKKYAMVDEGNTILSVVYLLKQAHLLPPDTVKEAANNLIGACDHYGISVPVQLKMAAVTGMSPVSGKSQSPYAKMSKFRKHDASLPGEGGEKASDENPRLGSSDGANDDITDRTNMSGTPGSNMMEVPIFPNKEKEKTAEDNHYLKEKRLHDSQGKRPDPIIRKIPNEGNPEMGWRHPQTDEHNPQHEIKTAGAFGDSPGDTVIKQKSWREVSYFDLTGWDPSMAGVDEPESPTLTLVDGHYPVDSYDQVKTASAYFAENHTEMDPRMRHRYCVKLAHRMDQLGMKVPEDIRRYGSETYASDVDSYVEARRPYVHEEYYEGLDLLLEKRAQVSPPVFAEALAEFDKMAGINWHWGGKIADPWWSTFGPSIEKTADDNWRWDMNGVRISEADLQWLARNAYERLTKSFGADFAKEFSKSPKAVFNSLPDPNKLILARLASDRFGGTE